MNARNPTGNEIIDIEMVDPRDLAASPWNPNRLSPEAELKLDASLDRNGMFKPVICRLVDDGLQILGGKHRVDSAIRLGWDRVPVVVLRDIDETRAREITLIDNGRYGRDDAQALADLISELGDPVDLAAFLPYELADLQAISAVTEIDLDDLGLDDEDAAPIEKPAKSQKTHEIMRLKLALGDADRVREVLSGIMVAQNFTESDELTNAGDALVWLVNAWLEQEA